MNILSIEDIKKIIPVRKPNSHKATYGKVLIIAGSRRFTGAAHICANACMKSGSGLVTLAVEKDIFEIMAQKSNEVMVLDIETYIKDFKNLIKVSDCIAIGCGMQKRKYTFDKILYSLENSSCPIVLDADAINIISENISLLDYDNTMILTPHEGEFARLSKLDIDYIKENKIEVAKKFAKKHNIILVLKGSDTIITNGDSIYISNIGVPAMATGGMGDALTGVIASFIGQKIPIMQAVCAGVYIHSYIARELSEKMYSVLASDIIERLSFTINDILIQN